jgi:hypothetical protein
MKPYIRQDEFAAVNQLTDEIRARLENRLLLLKMQPLTSL